MKKKKETKPTADIVPFREIKKKITKKKFNENVVTKGIKNKLQKILHFNMGKDDKDFLIFVDTRQNPWDDGFNYDQHYLTSLFDNANHFIFVFPRSKKKIQEISKLKETPFRGSEIYAFGKLPIFPTSSKKRKGFFAFFNFKPSENQKVKNWSNWINNKRVFNKLIEFIEFIKEPPKPEEFVEEEEKEEEGEEVEISADELAAEKESSKDEPVEEKDKERKKVETSLEQPTSSDSEEKDLFSDDSKNLKDLKELYLKADEIEKRRTLESRKQGKWDLYWPKRKMEENYNLIQRKLEILKKKLSKKEKKAFEEFKWEQARKDFGFSI